MNEDINVKSVKDAYMAFQDQRIPILLRYRSGSYGIRRRQNRRSEGRNIRDSKAGTTLTLKQS